MAETLELKHAVTLAANIAQAALAYKEQGFTDISVKQVNDPNDEGKLQEQILLDMKKDGQNYEVRLFSKQEGGKLTIKAKEGKANGKGK